MFCCSATKAVGVVAVGIVAVGIVAVSIVIVLNSAASCAMALSVLASTQPVRESNGQDTDCISTMRGRSCHEELLLRSIVGNSGVLVHDLSFIFCSKRFEKGRVERHKSQ